MTLNDFVDAALAHQGALYQWQGKGVLRWTPDGLVLHGLGVEVFDCSGLVTCALRECGAPDWRGSVNADVMLNRWMAAEDAWAVGMVRLYGVLSKASHVAISLGNGLVVEASGGDSHTTTLELARARGARVAIRRERRTDFLGARRPPLA